MKYTPVTAETTGYLPNILGKHYKTTIKDPNSLIIKSNTNNYIDCYGNLQSFNNNLPEFLRTTPLFSNSNIPLYSNTPGELWCLQAENQQYCKKNNNYILTPNISFNANDGINYYNNSAFSQNLITPGTLPNTNENPYPSNLQFSSNNTMPTTLVNEWLQTHLQPANNIAITNRHNPTYINIPEVFTEICDFKNYQSAPNF